MATLQWRPLIVLRLAKSRARAFLRDSARVEPPAVVRLRQQLQHAAIRRSRSVRTTATQFAPPGPSRLALEDAFVFLLPHYCYW